MSITMNSKHYQIDFGYGSFLMLRKKVAELTNEEIGEHYKYLDKATTCHDRVKFFEDYNKKIEELDDKFEGKYSGVLDFLYATDCSAKLSADVCANIYDIIKFHDKDDDLVIGYKPKKVPATFKDFKILIADCVGNNIGLEWY